MARIEDGLDAIVVPSGGSVEEDLQRARRAIRRNDEYERKTGSRVPYIISGVGPDMNKVLEEGADLDFHGELYGYMVDNTKEFIGMDIRSRDSVGNVLNTFPKGTSGTYEIVSYPWHLLRFKLIEKVAKLKGRIPKDVKIDYVPTGQSRKQKIRGLASLAKEFVRVVGI